MSEIRLEDININSLKESQDKNGQEQSTSTKYNSSNENGQPSSNVQKSKDKTDKEITNLTSIIEKESSTSKCLFLK